MHPQYTPAFHAYFDTRLEVHSATGCWHYTRGIDSNGYGMAWDGHKRIKAHRYAYILAYGPIPAGLVVMHTCERLYAPTDRGAKRCINPAHLKLGTHKDNMDDRDLSGHTPRGDRSGPHMHPERCARGANSGPHTHPERNKLTVRAVLDIRASYAAGGTTIYKLAAKYGVCPASISMVINRKTWTHV